MIAINIAHKDGAFWATPEAEAEAGLLNGMIECQRFAARQGLGSIAWDEITPTIVKGHAIASGERFAIHRADISMAEEDALTDWITEFVA
ncbi:hypothetical protein I5G62_gp90 [Mycobacterium phage CRB2]|uniref:Uncharacterized protein n=1 Tax=Mycobacterium phage CRB2 TaxID=2483623 RepID=A0A455LM45_9CAUD|nr:hypothetical protein I5G62_gp90 [Mycobacterium phage CRB2]AYP70076.1 hypothetical protein CRB2_90 [Mycobacterium phage CRB2]